MLFKVFLLLITLVYSNCQVWNCPCNPSTDLSCNCQSGTDTCYWWGDPHTRTFDGKWHHYQGLVYNFANGYPMYRYVSPCTSNFQLVPFQILAAHKTCPSSTYTCNYFNYIRLYNNAGVHINTLVIYLAGGITRVWDSALGSNAVSGAAVLYDPTVSGEFYRMTQIGLNIRLEIRTGKLCTGSTGKTDLVIRTSHQLLRVYVTINEYYEYLVCGLCGFYSGCTRDDFIKGPTTSTTCEAVSHNVPNWMGSYTTAHWAIIDEFGDSWRDQGPYVRRLQPGNTRRDPREDLDQETVEQLIQQVRDQFPDLNEEEIQNGAVDAVIICGDEVFNNDFCVAGALGVLDEAEQRQWAQQFIPQPDADVQLTDPALDLGTDSPTPEPTNRPFREWVPPF